MTDFEQFAFDDCNKEVCLFCGKESKEKYHSGTYETYSFCGCAASQQYYDLLDKAAVLKRVAEDRLHSFVLRKELKATVQRRKELRAEIKRRQKDE